MREEIMLSENVSSYIENNRDRFVADLAEYLSIPSVSALSEHRDDVGKAAEWVKGRLEMLGFSARVCPTDGHPIVLGRSPEVAGAPLLLVYGHYDVQPPDPLNEWVSPPFAPDIRGGYIYARGATDDKGQFLTYVKAVESILAAEGKLPLNLIFLVEGEEEIGSASFEKFLVAHKDELRANAVAISDGSQFMHGAPAITYGLRGLCYFQIDLQIPRIDLHSGVFGGMVHNPIQVLATLLASFKKPDGTVALPGFYDDVLPMEKWERDMTATLPLDVDALKNYLGVTELVGETGYSILERRGARPTFDVNGIWGGFMGEGAKTVIPARAGAKVSMRLVPNQSYARIEEIFRKYVADNMPPDAKVTITDLTSAAPVLVSRDSAAMRSAERAIEAGFGKKPVFVREGGSIPVVNLIKNHLKQDNILLLGWGCPDDGAHSPNERFCLDDFIRGIRSTAALFFELAG
ncbi:MAG: dipeptidase [Desulfobacteraceae bacterium]|nr:dipeptidase [Desulfobacteraceae bacterium]